MLTENPTDRGELMRKTITFILSILLLTGIFLPAKAEAAPYGSKAGAVTISGGTLNVRSSASTGGAVRASLKDGSYITLVSRSGDWWQVEYGDGLYGYCHADFVTPIAGESARVNITSGSLNIRSGAGTGYAKKSSLYPGEAVVVLSASGGWSRVLYDGTKTGYVYSAYLSNGSAAANAAVRLSVPSYKQTDNRWASVTLGSSGKTMARIGCTTTAIAMMESYRTGSTVTPAAMANRLSYTASGNVYWPRNYIPVTNGSGYLSTVLALLRQGKPVLLGATNSYGGQHWVVVTGFTGGSVTPSNFIINDPGSSSRTTLQQFLNAYPNFYKMFYYA